MRNMRNIGGCVGVVMVVAMWSAVAMAQEVRVIYVGETQSGAWHGVQLGQKEANILGRFTGQTYAVEPMSFQTLQEPDMTTPPVAVLAAADAEKLRLLSAKFAPLGVAVFNVASDDDALRQACLPNLLHMPPSARMKADAVAQWRQKHPDAQVQAQAWHSDFKKFAARDLNNRFRKDHNVPMDDAAWAGWAALKMLSETIARTQSTDPKRVLAYLREELEFDGQKGVPHTTRDTGQLRQPLLIVEAGKLLGEAPVRGVADSTDLDSLGLAACAK
ncbi:MAG: hypothetical protein OEU26_18225 [Candidatus Tectomicrobia bacterium]|nr:hypothetical protein [Candidatus Tectomicrobia bacterium]